MFPLAERLHLNEGDVGDEEDGGDEKQRYWLINDHLTSHTPHTPPTPCPLPPYFFFPLSLVRNYRLTFFDI
jgi:hypothetical protein